MFRKLHSSVHKIQNFITQPTNKLANTDILRNDDKQFPETAKQTQPTRFCADNQRNIYVRREHENIHKTLLKLKLTKPQT